MARSPRLQFEDALYYITVRGNNRQPLFRDHLDQGHYVELLNRYRERFGCRLYAYILLSNHLHLLLETPGANVGKFMQCLGTSYASYFNRKYRRRGTLFEGRYKSHLVDKGHLLEFTRHVHSCRFGPVAGEQRTRNQHSVEKNGLKQNPFADEASPHIAFLKGSIPPPVHPPGVSQEGSDLKRAEDILQEVTLSLGLSGVEDLREKRREALARHLAMYLIRKQTPLPLRLIGALLGVKPAAVAIAVGKVERLVKEGAFPSHIENLLKKSDLASAVR